MSSFIQKSAFVLMAVVFLNGTIAASQEPSVATMIGNGVSAVARGTYAGVCFVGRTIKKTAGTIIGLNMFSAGPTCLMIEHMFDPNAISRLPQVESSQGTFGPEEAAFIHHMAKSAKFVAIPTSFLGALILYRTWWSKDTPQECEYCAANAAAR